MRAWDRRPFQTLWNWKQSGHTLDLPRPQQTAPRLSVVVRGLGSRPRRRAAQGGGRSLYDETPTHSLVQAHYQRLYAEAKRERLTRCEHLVHAVDHLDAGAHSHLVSCAAPLHPHGETIAISTIAVSMGLSAMVKALTEIAAAPEKDVIDLASQRRPQRSRRIAPARRFIRSSSWSSPWSLD